MAKVKTLLEKVQSQLEDGERIEAAIAGGYEVIAPGKKPTAYHGMLAATNLRLIFFGRVLAFAHELHPMGYELVHSFKHTKGLTGHKIEFRLGNTQVRMNMIRTPAEVPKFVQVVMDRSPHARAFGLPTPLDPEPEPPAQNVADQIKKLGELHAEGVLTDEEFTAAKAQLLGL